MRKLRRGVMRHQAEKSDIKTKKAFRIMWKARLEKLEELPVRDIHNAIIKKKPKSMLRRNVDKIINKLFKK